MSSNFRFALDEKRYVIDAVNVVNSGKGYCHEGAPEDDKYLRERVLMVRLGEMLEKLIINLRPMKKLPWGEDTRLPLASILSSSQNSLLNNGTAARSTNSATRRRPPRSNRGDELAASRGHRSDHRIKAAPTHSQRASARTAKRLCRLADVTRL
jgi:hypothetical protein